MKVYYIIPSDNWEQQLPLSFENILFDYIIPSDNWEQQQSYQWMNAESIISYQAITGNNNITALFNYGASIISYQAITGNNNS